MSARVAVVTTVAGRHRHLAAQHRSLVAASRTPDLTVVVSLGDPEVQDVVKEGPLPHACDVFHEDVPVTTRLLDDVVANANHFHRRWGWFPMQSWLSAYDERGLAHYDGRTIRWVTGPRDSRKQ